WVVRSLPPESRTTTDISVSTRPRYALRRSGTCAFTIAAAVRRRDKADVSRGATDCPSRGAPVNQGRTTRAPTTRVRFNLLTSSSSIFCANGGLPEAIFRPSQTPRHIRPTNISAELYEQGVAADLAGPAWLVPSRILNPSPCR